MMFTRISKALALVCALTGTAAQAGDLDLTCKMDRTKRDWVMPQFSLYQRPNGTIQILDGAIYKHNDKKPVDVKVRKNTADEFDFTWRITLPSMQGNQIKLKYRAVLKKATGAVSVTAFLLERNQRSFARGNCAPR
ncbi:hypothetical protein [Primorskyibacter sp. 2E233]|uniref:hypothetical protein n=1 Tax=Primorskyibacter sp. 2E233 TaxID=3413431 RepID=UPI003BF2865A